MSFVTLPSATRLTDNTGTNIVALASGLPIPSGTFGLVVYNIPAGPQQVVGDINVSGITGPITLSGIISSNVVSSVPIAISNFPAVQTVTGTVGVSGVVVEVGNISISGLANVQVNNFPNPLTVNGSVAVSGSLPAGSNVIGHVIVDSLPTPLTVNGVVTLSGAPTITVSGTVNADIINFPASQNVVVTSIPSPVTINGSVAISGSLPTGTNTIGAITYATPTTDPYSEVAI